MTSFDAETNIEPVIIVYAIIEWVSFDDLGVISNIATVNDTAVLSSDLFLAVLDHAA